MILIPEFLKEENRKLKEEIEELKIKLREARYFGSDLNKFMNKLSKEMTVMNIDCLNIKEEQKIIRLIESKYPNEREMKWGQRRAIYNFLPSIFNQLNQISQYLDKPMRGWKFKVFLAYGEPLENGEYKELKIIDLIDNQKEHLFKGRELIDWLEFKKNEP